MCGTGSMHDVFSADHGDMWHPERCDMNKLMNRTTEALPKQNLKSNSVLPSFK